MQQIQKEYFLREQMKAIQKELGEGDDRQEELAEYREKMKSTAAKGAREKLERTEAPAKMPLCLQKLKKFAPIWIVCWISLAENPRPLRFDLAQEILDEDH